MKPSPVKLRAVEAELEILQPERARDPALEDRVAEIAPDIAVVVAYGKILPGPLLEVPPLGFINVHFSLLPAYRGAAPVQRAIIDGLTETGVSIIVLTEGMDEGPVITREPVAIDETDTAGSLGARFADVGAGILVQALQGYAEGTMPPKPQDHDRATYASKISTEQARIQWTLRPQDIRNLVRGLNPVPGAWTVVRGRRLKVHEAAVVPAKTPFEPGVLQTTDRLVVGAADGAVELTDVQLEGKRRMSGEELARGLRPAPGERFQ